MRTFLVLVLMVCLGVSSFAQPGPDTLWTRIYGWALDDAAYSVQRTFDGGFVFAGMATYPDSPNHSTCVFLIKADSLGQMQGWRAYGDGVNYYGALAVVQTNDSGYALAGYAAVAEGLSVSVCLKVNSLGDTVWSYLPVTIPPEAGVATSIVQVADSGLVVALSAWPMYAGGDPWAGLEKISSNGTYLWRWPVVDTTNILSHGLCVLADGSYALTGTEMVSSGSRAFLEHISAQGSPIAGNTYGGEAPYRDEAFDVVETPDGFLLAGRTSDWQHQGLFLCKTNAACEQSWIRRDLTAYSGTAHAMIPAMGGGYVVAGTALNESDTTSDMYLAKINDAGDILWERKYGRGENMDEAALDVIQTPDGGFVLVGGTSVSGMYEDWYIVKTLPDPDLLKVDAPILHPSSFRLSSFPNPFNLTTTLSFTLAKAGRTKIVIYDVTGRDVRTLADEMYDAGEHGIAFDGSALPSGIYFARMQSGKFAATQKLLLLK